MKRKLLFLIASIILCGSVVYGQSNHWTPGQFNFDANCNIWWGATLDGETLTSSDIEVAAFVGDECRATARIAFHFELDGEVYHVGQMQVPHTGVVEVTFKMYDHATETEYDVCSTTITTSAEEEVLGLVNGRPDPVYCAFSSPEAPEPFGPDYPWVAPIGAYNTNMSITAEIQIDGVPVTEADRWELAAFCGEECRGDQKGLGDGPFGILMYLTVYGLADDVLDFYLYDLDNGETYPGVCETTVTYVPQGGVGEVWEPFVLNFVTIHTYTKVINPYTTDGGYYLIASPIGTVEVTAVGNMVTESDFDLYAFDQSGEGDETHEFLEWINYEQTSNEFTHLDLGKGYLYANAELVTLTFTGAPYTGEGLFELDYNPQARLAGWNLLGNPYAETAYVDRDFYTMKDDGSEIVAATNNSIEAMEGIFVVAEAEGETVTFTTTEPNRTTNGLVMNVTHNRGAVVDRAIVRFGEKRGLPKFQLNSNSTKLYIPQNGTDFAVVNAEAQGEMPVNFKAAKNGTYTLNFSSEKVTFSYLHLIDNMTGVDVDLLATPFYSFNATTTDYESRFKLVFATSDADSDSFAFINNGNIIIPNVDANATLQIVDALGHVLVNRSATSCISTSGLAHGVYMLRLINGDNVKVQKIVVQ